MRFMDGHEILGLLGQGGMSRVLKVRSALDGRICALKLLRPHPHLADLLGLEEIQRRFQFEAGVLARTDHPHVVRLLGQRLEGARWYMLLEYHCRTVGEWIGESPLVEEPSRPLRPDLALEVARQTASALEALHGQGLVHRDVKPANLLLDGRKRVKLADFGLSKLRGEREVRPSQLMVGSPFYAPPEQERDPESVDQRADWYALGVVLYRMISGGLPGENLDWSPIIREFGAKGGGFLGRMLASKPAERPAGAAEVLEGLDAMARYWRIHREAVCRMRWEEHARTARRGARDEKPREQPRKVGGHDAREMFMVDALWRPVRPKAKRYVVERETVSDPDAGRLWQRSGSAEPLEWGAAREHVRRLNRERWAGRSTWRLPTVDELLTLLEPDAPLDDFCLQPLFDRRQLRLWSADRRTFIAAWIVDVESGYLGWQDFTCPAFVRAVSTVPD
ncbi:protein kinase domain-containing protein [Desulfonatronum lacustre]|uniref:protein kinase domain-containing protein n=1 Tax=Desulfonatronum lacustre TaxID=66849 RepID=UPI0004906065|nr:protein kinase [Desulfonatronum lacustre]